MNVRHDMTFIRFLQSPAGRIVRIAIGFALLWYGARNESLIGLMLMMLGLVPVVTGVLGVCLLEELTREYRESHGVRAVPSQRPHEGHV
jgi:hypothetical protein